MGRKSDKSKEKKKQRKEESAKMVVSRAKVDKANKVPDPMDFVKPFRKFDRNGLSLTIEFKRITDMSEEEIQWAFDLTKKNMQTLYEESEWGWKDKDKREEMTEDKALYLIARDTNNKPVAFTHFRFDIEIDEEVLYCYEIQVIDDVRRKGIGKFIVQILELMAYQTEMAKVMLTTFKHNKVAQGFFKNTMKYVIDEISPEDPLFEEGYHYEILSKPIKQKPNKTGDASNGQSNKAVVEPMQTSPIKAS